MNQGAPTVPVIDYADSWPACATQPPLSDTEREKAIHALTLRITCYLKLKQYDAVRACEAARKALIEGRSDAQVAKMERDMGLAQATQ